MDLVPLWPPDCDNVAHSVGCLRNRRSTRCVFKKIWMPYCFLAEKKKNNLQLTTKNTMKKKQLIFRTFCRTWKIDHHQTSFDNSAVRWCGIFGELPVKRQRGSSEIHGLSSNLALLVARISPETKEVAAEVSWKKFTYQTKRKEPTRISIDFS